MEPSQVIRTIKSKLEQSAGAAGIPLLQVRNGSDCFTATLVEGGVDVGNLSGEPFLRWEAFEEAVKLMTKNGRSAKRGNAQKFKLHQEGLPLDSIEGHERRWVYGKREGDWVFRRITPIACILIWAGFCKSSRGELHILQR